MDAEVIVIGLGPAGAALCGLLAKRGIRVIGIDKSGEVFPQPRAAHIDHTGLRTLQEIGCLDALLPNMVRNVSLDLVNADHQLLLRVDASQASISGLPTSVYFYQPAFDRTLRDTIASMPGMETRLSREMTAFSQDADGVTVTTVDPEGRQETLRAQWLIGCDGAWSPVREAISSKLESLDFDERWLVLDIDLHAEIPDLPIDRVVQVCDPKRPHTTTPISRNRQRFEFMVLKGETDEEITRPDNIEAMLDPWMKAGSYSIARQALYTFHGLVAEQWRVGRALIAGDAAHQMPPFLGQGMCSGLRDSSNLAWKLAAVIRHQAPATLLDTYQLERSPHVKKITQVAIEFGRLVCMTDAAQAEQRDRMLLDPDAHPEDQLGFQLPRLDKGPLILDKGGNLFIQPEIDGRKLDDIVGHRFLVLARDQDALGATADWWRERGALVTCLDALGSDACLVWMDRFKTDVVVVRPDRYVLGTAHVLDDITRKVQPLLAQQEAACGSHKLVAAS